MDELQLQKAIRLSELPLPGKILAVYQRIGSKPHAESVGKKRGIPRADHVAEYGEKKVKVLIVICKRTLQSGQSLNFKPICHQSEKKLEINLNS